MFTLKCTQIDGEISIVVFNKQVKVAAMDESCKKCKLNILILVNASLYMQQLVAHCLTWNRLPLCSITMLALTAAWN